MERTCLQLDNSVGALVRLLGISLQCLYIAAPAREHLPPEAQEPAIRVTREDIKKTYEYIELLKNATLEESGITPRQLDRLKNPPQERFEIKDADTLLSIKIFMACGNASQETYNAVADAIKEHSPHINVLSLAQVCTSCCSLVCFCLMFIHLLPGQLDAR